MAVTTKGILSPRLAGLKVLDTTNVCSYNRCREDGGRGSLSEDQLAPRGCRHGHGQVSLSGRRGHRGATSGPRRSSSGPRGTTDPDEPSQPCAASAGATDVEDVTALLQGSMSALATPTRSEPAELRVSPLINQFLERVVSDLPYDDVAGRLQRRQYVIDRLKLEFSKDAARLAAEFANEDAGELLDAATAGEWIRHNCRTSRSVAYECINVGEQLYRLPKSADALTTGAIGFAHLSVIARTSSALAESTP